MLQQLAKRRVLRVLSGYSVVCFVILQLADVTFEPLNIDYKVLRGMIAVMVVSFPIVAYLAWVFDIDGAKPNASPTTPRSALIELTLATTLTLAMAVFMWWQWQAPITDSTTSLRTDAVKPTQLSIAVLPFANMSADPDQEYFSDGLTEELMNVLARYQGLRVISRTSAFSFKGRGLDLSTIAAELQVSHILEGSVRSNGDQVRITAQLSESA